MIVGGSTARQGQFHYQIPVFNEVTFFYFGIALIQANGTQVVMTTALNLASLYSEDISLRGGVINWEVDNPRVQQW